MIVGKPQELVVGAGSNAPLAFSAPLTLVTAFTTKPLFRLTPCSPPLTRAQWLVMS